MKDLYTKHLQKYKYLDQKEIKKDIFKLFSKIDCGDELSKNWLYLTLLIIAFLNHEHENDGLELANIINSKFKLNHNEIVLDGKYDELKTFVSENHKNWMSYIVSSRTGCFDVNSDKKAKAMAQYIAACISFKKVICERELSFIEQIGRVQLNKKQLVYDLKNNHFKKIEEDNTTYFVVSNVNYLFSNNPNHLWGPTIELEGKAHSIHEANIIAKNAYENKFKSSSNRDDETDFEINFAIQDNEPLKIYSKKIRNSHGSGILFLTIIGIELKKLDGYKYICFGATTIGEGPEIGYHSQLPSYYRSKDEVIKTISTFEDDDTQFIDKDANNLSIEIQDDLAEPFGIIKFFEI